MAYEASRGGHAPRYLREDFLSALAEYVDLSDEDAGADFVRDRLHRLCGLLWNCTDLLPKRAYEDVGLFVASDDETPCGTYLEAARHIRWRLDRDAEMGYGDPGLVIRRAINCVPELEGVLCDYDPGLLLMAS